VKRLDRALRVVVVRHVHEREFAPAPTLVEMARRGERFYKD
jgi:hypothetical protein